MLHIGNLSEERLPRNAPHTEPIRREASDCAILPQPRSALGTRPGLLPQPEMFRAAAHSSCLTLSLPSSKSTFSQPSNDKCISEVVRIGNIITAMPEKPSSSYQCDVIFLARAAGNLKLITLGSERVQHKVDWPLHVGANPRDGGGGGGGEYSHIFPI